MATDSKIEWTTHTFNGWIGCTKISPGCKNCYAESRSRRLKDVVWGPSGTRRVAAENQWSLPLRWNADANALGVRHRVFCASLADVFEQWEGPMVTATNSILYAGSQFSPQPGLSERWWSTQVNKTPLTMDDVRVRLFDRIRQTPHLDWLLLTKRPEGIQYLIGRAACLASQHPELCEWLKTWATGRPPKNVWLGSSTEDQETADKRIPWLLKTPAHIRFLSYEPALEAVNIRGHALSFNAGRVANCVCGHGHGFTRCPNTGGVSPTCPIAGCHCPGFRRRPAIGLHWVIVGGESGRGARPMRLEWARSIVTQCRDAGVACFVKQLGQHPASTVTRSYDETITTADGRGSLRMASLEVIDDYAFEHPKGGDPAEWPEDLRVRQFPITE